MVTKDLLRRVIYDQRELMEGLGVDRQILKEQIAAPEILVISGVREALWKICVNAADKSETRGTRLLSQF